MSERFTSRHTGNEWARSKASRWAKYTVEVDWIREPRRLSLRAGVEPVLLTEPERIRVWKGQDDGHQLRLEWMEDESGYQAVGVAGTTQVESGRAVLASLAEGFELLQHVVKARGRLRGGTNYPDRIERFEALKAELRREGTPLTDQVVATRMEVADPETIGAWRREGIISYD